METKILLKKPKEDTITIRELKETLNQIEESDLDMSVSVFSGFIDVNATKICIGKCTSGYTLCISG